MGTVVGVVKGVASRMKAWGGCGGSAVFNVAAACTEQRSKTTSFHHIFSRYMPILKVHCTCMLFRIIVMYIQSGLLEVLQSVKFYVGDIFSSYASYKAKLWIFLP